MEREMKKQELIDELAERTGFFKHNMKDVANALEDIILDNLKMAEFDKDSKLQLAPGVVITGKRKASSEAKDPRTGETIITPEKVMPYCIFKPSIRQKLYERKKRGKK